MVTKNISAFSLICFKCAYWLHTHSLDTFFLPKNQEFEQFYFKNKVHNKIEMKKCKGDLLIIYYCFGDFKNQKFEQFYFRNKVHNKIKMKMCNGDFINYILILWLLIFLIQFF